MSKKLTYEEVKRTFKDNGCELLSENYKNAVTPLKYLCNCGSVSKIALSSFKQGHRCKKCGRDKLSKIFSHSYNYIKSFFEKEGCVLLSENYKNSQTKLEFICNCGNKSVNTFQKFKEGRRCSECGMKIKIEKMKHSYEYVENSFKEKGCKLISKIYINDATPLDYICSCGNKSKITFNSLYNGSKCNKCGVERTKGKNSVHWNPNLTDEERTARRDYPEYAQWRKKVYKNDYWTCQCCSQIGKKLNAHHIQNYSSYRYLRLVVSNGTTLCSKCHLNFHSIYGKKNNTFSQLEEFLSEFKSKVLNDDKVIVSV